MAEEAVAPAEPVEIDLAVDETEIKGGDTVVNGKAVPGLKVDAVEIASAVETAMGKAVDTAEAYIVVLGTSEDLALLEVGKAQIVSCDGYLWAAADVLEAVFYEVVPL